MITAENKEMLDAPEIVQFDVRPILLGGVDPLQQILAKVNELKDSQVLELTNSFMPVPLFHLLEKKGFAHEIVLHSDKLCIVKFWKSKTEIKQNNEPKDIQDSEDWDQVFTKYASSFVNIDVRHLSMPQPMISILEAIDVLGKNEALYVKHHKVPLFLLPELAERKIEFRIRRVDDNELHLILFHK